MHTGAVNLVLSDKKKINETTLNFGLTELFSDTIFP